MRLRLLPTIYIAVIALGAVSLMVVGLTRAPLPTTHTVALAAIFVVLMALASLFPCHLPSRRNSASIRP
jgi:hypothetical protein